MVGGYSRRELLADGVVHVTGITCGLMGLGALATISAVKEPPTEIKITLAVYGVSLLSMLLCSAVFNCFAWSKKDLWALQLADHTGILLLIAGTYTPTMAMSCCSRTLAFVWSLALISFVVKASKSRLDVVALHVPCFLGMGWAAVLTWSDIMGALTPWAKHTMILGGVLYTGGLAPWAYNRMEFHNAIWHTFVLWASCCFYAVIFLEVAQPENWAADARKGAGASGVCLMA